MKRQLVFFMGIVFLSACSLTGKKDVLQTVKKHYPHLSFRQPQLDQVVEDDFESPASSRTYYYSDSLEGKYVKVRIYEFPATDSVALASYEQHWLDGIFFNTLSIMEDTLYWLINRVGANEVSFVQGEYEYRRWGGTSTRKKMERNEAIYYDLYQDSLRKVKGNHLPLLPNPTNAEIKLWKEKFPHRILP